MHNFILQMFKFLKSATHFFKIVIVFYIMLHLLFWTQSLIGTQWAWLSFALPVLNLFNEWGAAINNNSVMLFEAVFEYKYIIAVGFYIIIYFSMNLVMMFWDYLEDKYDDVHRYTKKQEEKAYNDVMMTEQPAEEFKINNYKILVSTNLKRKFSHAELGYNLEEQNRIMNKFLMDKTGVNPEMFEGGFLYSFGNFNNVDKILEIFFKLIKSNSPLDYKICIQVFGENSEKCKIRLKELLNLNFQNKIVMYSDTSYRYRFNNAHRYGTSQLGVFQKGNDTTEVHEFAEI